jgi:hypothetical protein
MLLLGTDHLQQVTVESAPYRCAMAELLARVIPVQLRNLATRKMGKTQK